VVKLLLRSGEQAAAPSAALQWRFNPARIGDRAVASDYVIVFKFRR
jgi:hypothetical protein